MNRLTKAWNILLATWMLGGVTVHASPPPIDTSIEQLRVKSGWAVHVGTSDGEIERQLASHPNFIVTGLAYDEPAEIASRQRLADAGLAGRAAVHRVLDDSRLPMAERSVAVLVISRPPVAEEEIQRVLRPGGVALVDERGQWRSIQAPAFDQLEQIDDWSHFNYDATQSDASDDELVGPARSLRWLGGDPSQSNTSNIIGPRSIGGIVVRIDNNDWSRLGRRVTPWHSPPGPNGTIVARDAFSGAVLWRREGFFVRSRYSFVLDEERVYLHAMDKRHFVPTEHRAPTQPNPRPLMALDLHTGQDAAVYDKGLTLRTAGTDKRGDPIEVRAELMTVLVHRGKLIQRAGGTVAVLKPSTGKLLWKLTPEQGKVGMIAVDGDRIIGMVGPGYSRPSMGYLGGTPIFKTEAIVAWDLTSGKELYRVEPPALDDAPHAIRVAVRDGHIGVVSYGKYKNVGLDYTVTCFSASDGRQLWSHEGPGKVMSGGHYPRPQIHQGRLWATGAGGGIGWNLEDGSEPLKRMTRNFRCSTNRATPNWLISSQNFTNIKTGKAFFTEATRGRCDFGLFPANGLTYSTLGNQCDCNAFIRSTSAHGTDRLPAEPWQGERLLTGPAGRDTATAWSLPENDWPRMLKDARHSAWTDEKLSTEPTEAWELKLAEPAGRDDPLGQEWETHEQMLGLITPATVLGEVGIVGIGHEQTLVGFDPATGEQLWRTHVDGRIDSPPVQVNASAFVGTRSGWVYALDRRTGKVRWRFLAAPHQRLVPVNGQAESAWPVFGSLLIHDGLVWAAAGRSAEVDHGIYWYGLDPATGEVRRSGRLAELADEHESFRADRTRATNTVLTTNGRQIIFYRSGIDPETGEQTRFGNTVKSWRLPHANNGLVDAWLPPVNWGWSRVAEGGHFQGIGGALFAFKGDAVYAVTQTRHGDVGFYDLANRDAMLAKRQHSAARKPEWQTRMNVRLGHLIVQPVAAFARADNALVGATAQHLWWGDPKDGEDLARIGFPQVATHGLAIAHGRLYVSTRDGKLVALK